MELPIATSQLSTSQFRWPDAGALQTLEEGQLLAIWLGRRIETVIAHDRPLEHWQEQQFNEPARQLFLELGSALDQVCLSLLQSDDAHLAQEWYFKLQEGDADFRTLALESPGINRQRAGSLGPMRLEELQTPLDRLALRAPLGLVQPPLRMPSGQNIVLRLDLRQPAQWDEPTRLALIQRLHRRWLAQAVETFISRQPVPGEICSIPLP